MEKIVVVFFFIFLGCSPVNQKTDSINKEHLKQELTVQKTRIKELKFVQEKPYRVGDLIAIEYELSTSEMPDSVKIAIDGNVTKSLPFSNNPLVFDSKGINPGKHSLLVTFFWKNTYQESKTIQIPLNSDIEPEKFGYRIIKAWPHNTKAYTQGLEFYNGFLYEGTGQKGTSMLFKIDVGKNEIVQSLNLPSDVFGEGITIFDKKIYQLTWQSNVGYVYDVTDLKKLYEFNYPTEGWGLTNNGKQLIMSDGTENIYFLDSDYFQETHRLQVYNHNGPVKYLNELELIGNEIYANVYGTDMIIAFDIATGKVTREIDLTGILNSKEVKEPIDVLNGIAYNKEKKQLVVTGKWWPRFFEIELIKK